MNFIEIQVSDVYDEIEYGGIGENEIVDYIGNASLKFSPQDNIKFFEGLKQKFQTDYEKHALECGEPNQLECSKNKKFIKVLYYLNNEIESLKVANKQVPVTSDFTDRDIQALNDSIDRILQDLKSMKDGQEIIWTDIMQELSELKEFYFLNKKNWRQLLQGKVVEMVAGGVISDTISKKIVEAVNPIASKLLD